MNIERKYITELISENEKLETHIKNLTEKSNEERRYTETEIKKLKNENRSLTENINTQDKKYDEHVHIMDKTIKELQTENTKLKKDLKSVKENIRAIPSTNSNATTKIFELMKEGGVVTPLKNKLDQQVSTYPFKIMIGNQMAFYDDIKLVGMAEYKDNILTYYPIKKELGREIGSAIIHNLEINKDCKYTINKNKKGRKVKNMDLLINGFRSTDGLLISSKYNYYRYEEKDGSTFIMTDKGKEYL